MTRPLPLLLLLAACGTTAESGAPCQASVYEVSPSADASEVLFVDPVSVQFAGPASGGTLTLAGPDGEVVAEASADADATSITIAPRLEPSTTYTVVAEVCDDVVTQTFSTSAVGAEVDISVVDGASWEMDFTGVALAEPASNGLEALLISGMEDLVVLVGTEGTGPVDMIAAIGTADGRQDLCSRTFALEDAAFGNPDVQFYMPVLELPWDDMLIRYHDATLRGGLTADGEVFTGITLSATVDTVTMVPGLEKDPAEEPMAVCDVLDGLGVACGPCPDSDLETCVPFEISGLSATSSDTRVIEMTDADIAERDVCIVE